MNRQEERKELTKLEVAQRQLDAAIRMFLSSEEDLAIHTLGAAAYRIFRDLKEKTGRTELTDLISGAAFNIAKQIAEGTLSDVPTGGDDFRAIVRSLVEGFRSGTLVEPMQVEITVAWERRHWKEFNETANFLKHADKDVSSTLDVSKLENARLINDAIRAYAALAGSITTPMAVFEIWLRPEWPVFSELMGDRGRQLALLDLDSRRAECLALIGEFDGRKGGYQ